MTLKRAKSLIFCLLFFILFCGSNAMAIDLYGFGSYWDKEDVDGTWGGGLGLSIPLFTQYVRLDGRAYFFENADLGTDELKLMPFDLGVQVHILPENKVDPYLLGGVSYLYVDADRIDVDDSNIGGYVGVGLDVALGNSVFKIFGEALYRFNEIETKIGDDINVGGFTGNIGIKLHF